MRQLIRCMLTLTAGALFVAAQGDEIQIVYDNNAVIPRMLADHGFSAVVLFRGSTILFDAGADGGYFLRNLKTAGIAEESITHAVISHHHVDHREGIYRLGLTNRTMQVFFLDTFPAGAFEVAMAVGLHPIRVRQPREIAPGAYTTGIVGDTIPEQALVLETQGGLVVLVGCAHPGLARMVETARQQRGGKPVKLLLGGFHMERFSDRQIRDEITALRRLGVEQVAPAHCTGEKAKQLFRREWGADYVATGAGRRIPLE